MISAIMAIGRFLLDLWTNNSTVITSVATASIVVGATFAYIDGYEGTKKAELKIGLAYHSQGDALVETNDGAYQHWNVFKRELYGPKFDLSAEGQREWATWVSGIGPQRFGNEWGSSYTVIATPDSVFWTKPIDGVGAHASGFNFPLVGLLLTRTDNDSLNALTLYQARLAVSAIKDSLQIKWDQEIDMAVFHADISINGKTDPQEFTGPINDLGLRWDNRKSVARLKGVPTLRQAKRNWDETTKELMK